MRVERIGFELEIAAAMQGRRRGQDLEHVHEGVGFAAVGFLWARVDEAGFDFLNSADFGDGMNGGGEFLGFDSLFVGEGIGFVAVLLFRLQAAEFVEGFTAGAFVFAGVFLDAGVLGGVWSSSRGSTAGSGDVE